MSSPRDLVIRAFDLLAKKTGYSRREEQLNLALVLYDLIDGGSPAAIEAPTGIGKSLACLIPALAHSLNGKRTVIATYTNVLAEQYWTKDLPLAMSLFEDVQLPPPAYLIGRSRYTCVTALRDATQGPASSVKLDVDAVRYMVAKAKIGTEAEFKKIMKEIGVSSRSLGSLWNASSAPAACPARACPDYDACFYYRARDAAQKAGLVITNHSVVIRHCTLQRPHEDDDEDAVESAGLLGTPDYIILDEAHDFAQAAASGLEFELSKSSLDLALTMARRIESHLFKQATLAHDSKTIGTAVAALESKLSKATVELGALQTAERDPLIAASPSEWLDHQALKSRLSQDALAAAERLAGQASAACRDFRRTVAETVKGWETEGKIQSGEAAKSLQAMNSYFMMLAEFESGSGALPKPRDGQISWVTKEPDREGVWIPALRTDTIDIRGALRELLWDRFPTACLSATLAVDGSFEFLNQSAGFKADYEEIFPSPFDHSVQAAFFLPPEGTVPDPSSSRGPGQEMYYQALAQEISRIIRRMNGRTLALFHSRKEMEEVHRRISLPPELPVLIQPRGSASLVGDAFKANLHASLFGVRSFWTGFDAAGETLSCVILTRIPFEVPVLPTQIARMVMLSLEGLDPFAAHTLAQAKMMIRQGAGRLIRRETDEGLICLLDPRVKTKPYGEGILENLPRGMRQISSLEDDVIPGDAG